MKPFLKWVGGKYKIINTIQTLIPKREVLVEPFMGSGSVFLNTDYDFYLLYDLNQHLVNLYRTVQTEGKDFAYYAESLFTSENNTETRYYALREEFNYLLPSRRKSAIFIYLNRHGFNGLCRYNSKGLFNVPFGRYSKPYFPLEELINFSSKSKRAEFKVASYTTSMLEAPTNSVVYCDPPYVQLSVTANFSSYTSVGFSLNDQKQLTEMAKTLQAKGIPVVISNHDTEFTRELYKEAEITSFEVQRFISSKGTDRAKAPELVAVYGYN